MIMASVQAEFMETKHNGQMETKHNGHIHRHGTLIVVYVSKPIDSDNQIIYFRWKFDKIIGFNISGLPLFTERRT